MVFVIHLHESAMDIHVFPIPIPPPTSLSKPHHAAKKREKGRERKKRKLSPVSRPNPFLLPHPKAMDGYVKNLFLKMCRELILIMFNGKYLHFTIEGTSSVCNSVIDCVLSRTLFWVYPNDPCLFIPQEL